MAAYRFDPRGDLPPPMIQSTYYKPLHPKSRREGDIWHAARSPMKSNNNLTSHTQFLRPATAPLAAAACHDWIFSSASNVHVVVDRSQFRTYTSFKSYVLRMADQSPVKVRGIGTVQLKIRRQPGSKESHTITLENVLHVPKWICNVFSDVYFEPITDFEHTWTDFGVSFLKKEDGQLRYWGFTEGFLGLERLVLAKRTRGRSPMLEDRDREVFSVNLTWPQGQRDRWETQLAADEKRRQAQEEMRLRRVGKSGLTEMTTMTSPMKILSKVSFDMQPETRSVLTDLNANIMMHRRAPSDRVSSLKAPTIRSRGNSLTERFSSVA